MNRVSKLTPLKLTLWVLLVLTVFHIAIAFSWVNQAADAAHYALYAQHLAWSYFDHPPMVGWLQALVVPFSHNDAALQIVPIILALLWPLLLYRLAQLLFADESPWLPCVAVLISQAASILYALSFAYTPQSPLLCAALAALIAFYKALQTGQWRYWLLTGLFFGLAALCDYTAVFLVVFVLLYLLTTRRDCFTKVGLWCAALVAIVVSSPVFLWNATHGWISILYQLHHGTGGSWKIGHVLTSQVIQFAAYSPLFYVLGYIALISGFKREWGNTTIRFLCFAAAPLLLFYWVTSAKDQVLPHWPAFAWVCLCPLMARFILQRWQRKGWRVYTYIGAIYSAFLILLVTANVLYLFLPFSYLKNPLRDLYGWRLAGQVARQELQAMPQQGANKPQLFVSNWSLGSRIAWYSQEPIFVAGKFSPTQFSLWYGNLKQGAYGVLVMPAGWKVPDKAGQRGNFSRCVVQRVLPVYHYGRLVNKFTYYRCYGYSS